MYSPAVAEPSTSAAATRIGPLPAIGPEHLLALKREFKQRRVDDVRDYTKRIQDNLTDRLESSGKRIRKGESLQDFVKMKNELSLLQRTTASIKSATAIEGSAILQIIGKVKPPEPEKPVKMGRKGRLDTQSKSQIIEESQPQPVPAKPVGIMSLQHQPLQQPPPSTTPTLVPPSTTPTPQQPAPIKPPVSDKTPKDRSMIRINRPLSHPSNPSTPQPAPTTPQPAPTPHTPMLNGNGESPESPPPTAAINKGKRRAAATTAAVAVSANSVSERPEKRPKREVKKKVVIQKATKLGKGKDEPEETYCSCDRISFGEMVACDNESCAIQWFHFECVQLTSKPKGKWFCPDCRQPDNERLPRMTTPQSVIKTLSTGLLKKEQAFPHPAQAQA